MTLSFNPYVGPRRFEENDSILYFGREFDVESLLSLILSQRLVLFYSPSGAGKSSLLRARLLPHLRDEEQFQILPIGRVSGAESILPVSPENIFVSNLKHSLQSPNYPNLYDHKNNLVDYLHREQDKASEPSPRILVIDQFEEIVTTNLDRWQDREEFFLQLRELMSHDKLLWILLVMREDHVAELDSYVNLLPGRLSSRYYMRRMDEKSAKEAISEPAKIGGRVFSSDLVDALVDNLRQIKLSNNNTGLGEFIEPVQLQVVCYQLWRNLEGLEKQEVSLVDVPPGDIDGALSNYYDRSVAAIAIDSNISESSIRDWFEQKLITSQGTRSKVNAADVANLPKSLIDALVARYLVRSEIWAGGTWYELVHDRFIEPILKSNKRWFSQQSSLYQIAREWDFAGKPHLMLLSGEALVEALRTVDPVRTDSVVQKYLEECETAEQNRLNFEAAEAERLSRKRRRILMVSGTFIILSLSILLFLAINSAAIAETNRLKAEANRLAAEKNLQIAEVNRLTAEAGATALQDEIFRVTEALAIADSAIAIIDNLILQTPTIESTETHNRDDPNATPTILTVTTPIAFPLPVPTFDNSLGSFSDIKATRAAFSELPAIEEIGISAGGIPIKVTRFGSGSNVVLLVGGITGGFAPSSISFADSSIDYFSRFPNEIPDGTSLHVISILNPDAPISPGNVEGRLNSHGVDINRNFDCAWSGTITFRNAEISNGSSAFSEPESQALKEYILNIRPMAVIFTGARATPSQVLPGLCNNADSGSVDLATVYAGERGFHIPQVAISGTGDPADWVTTLDIPSIFILLQQYNSLSDDELEANMIGLKAVLNSRR